MSETCVHARSLCWSQRLKLRNHMSKSIFLWSSKVASMSKFIRAKTKCNSEKSEFRKHSDCHSIMVCFMFSSSSSYWIWKRPCRHNGFRTEPPVQLVSAGFSWTVFPIVHWSAAASVFQTMIYLRRPAANKLTVAIYGTVFICNDIADAQRPQWCTLWLSFFQSSTLSPTGFLRNMAVQDGS